MITTIKTNQIYLGDAYELIKQVPDNFCDLAIIDPPYDIRVSHGSGAFGVKKRLHYKQFEFISNGFDFMILNELTRVLKKINIYIFCSLKQIPVLLDYFVIKRKCYYNIICWHKTNPVPTCGNSYMPDTEYCLFFREKGVRVFGTPKTKATYYITPTNKADKRKWGHPTIKPEHIITNFILNSSSEGDTIIDCFGGSGTTAICAYKTNRDFILFEKEQKYYKTSLGRFGLKFTHGIVTLHGE